MKCNEVVFHLGTQQHYVCEAERYTEHTHGVLTEYMRLLTEEDQVIREAGDILVVLENAVMCRDCKQRKAEWFNHDPQDCCNYLGCDDCYPHCGECMRYHLHLLQVIQFGQN